MERLLVMRLRAQGCSAEAWLNDIAVARVGPQGGTLCLPVHEYLLDGGNEVSLVIDPATPGAPGAPTVPRLAEGAVNASLQLLLPRIGQVASESQARTVADIVWAPPDGDVYTTPVTVSRSAFLPIKFPRWRWLDAPQIEDVPAQHGRVCAFLQTLVVDLLRGEVDSFLTASRLRLEELALAYQQPVADVTTRLRSRLQLLHATKALKMTLPPAGEIVLRSCAGARLLECMRIDGQPALVTAPTAQGASSSWPVRVAIVNGRCHILR